MSRQTPYFSIVVPTYNRPRQLHACVQSLAGLDYPKDRFEVLIVDDGSTEAFDRADFNSAIPENFRIVRQPNGGPGAARNKGASLAVGDYLAFTDDDCQPQPGWLRALARASRENPEAMLGGFTCNGVSGNPCSEASAELQNWLYDWCATRNPAMRFFASSNLSLPTEAFHKLGGFETRKVRLASEDRELCGRWLAAGLCLCYVPEAVIYHYHQLDGSKFLAQHFAYGRGAFRLRQARAAEGLPPLPSDPRWILRSIVDYPFRSGFGWHQLQLASLSFATHAANTAGYFYERFLSRQN
jgi:GT2 family glycosyltransferase